MPQPQPGPQQPQNAAASRRAAAAARLARARARGRARGRGRAAAAVGGGGQPWRQASGGLCVIRGSKGGGGARPAAQPPPSAFPSLPSPSSPLCGCFTRRAEVSPWKKTAPSLGHARPLLSACPLLPATNIGLPSTCLGRLLRAKINDVCGGPTRLHNRPPSPAPPPQLPPPPHTSHHLCWFSRGRWCCCSLPFSLKPPKSRAILFLYLPFPTL